MDVINYDYKIASVNSIEGVAAFLNRIRKIDNAVVENIDLNDNNLRNSEGGMSTVLSGEISDKEFINEIVKKNIDTINIYLNVSDEIVCIWINLRTWDVSVSLRADSGINVKDLEKYF